ncbi:type II toxin-antitoxin system CcdA family antitoxin, partial [Accumulibacter sp.]|uniref:type II toxin-antitoxin system CcdA family antitoxin n=1 Tax=Accumulibacter sp. TaxID=2053492 RepID=UPI0028C4BD30
MQAAHDTHARKKTTTLSINADLLSKARSMNINLSANPESPPPMFEQALRNID